MEVGAASRRPTRHIHRGPTLRPPNETDQSLLAGHFPTADARPRGLME
jgi:hypothetical protein